MWLGPVYYQQHVEWRTFTLSCGSDFKVWAYDSRTFKAIAWSIDIICYDK